MVHRAFLYFQPRLQRRHQLALEGGFAPGTEVMEILNHSRGRWQYHSSNGCWRTKSLLSNNELEQLRAVWFRQIDIKFQRFVQE